MSREHARIQFFPAVLAIENLRGKFRETDFEYLTRAEAFELLREGCDEDFGEDIDKWEEWVRRKYAHVRSQSDR